MGYDAVGNVVVNEGPEESNFLGVYCQGLSSLLKKVEQDGTDDGTVVSGESVGSVAADLNAPGGKLYWVSGDLIPWCPESRARGTRRRTMVRTGPRRTRGLRDEPRGLG